MNNVLDSIMNIDAVAQEADMNVVYSLMDVIDKNELIQEYSEDEAFPEIFIESMMWYMESKNRERDKTPRNEIAQWMEKNGYWYTGDNPKKKKECNRMYHFLQQHEFDPKDETLKTDIKTGDSENKRIKFKIDNAMSITDSDKKFMREIANKYGKKNDNGNVYVDPFEIPYEDPNRERAMKLIDKYEANSTITQTKNAAYDIMDDKIIVSSKTLKEKQPESQFTYKHEEGHGDVHNTDESNKKKIKEMEKIYDDARKYNKKFIKQGAEVNIHDLDPEENVADAYAVMNARKRTKNWGKNKETKPLNSRDVLYIFRNMSNSLKSLDNSVNSEITKIDNKIKELHGLVGRDWKKEDINYFNASSIEHIIDWNKQIERKINAVNKIIPELEKSTSEEVFMKYMNKGDEIRNKCEEMKKSQNVNNDELKKLEDEYENIRTITSAAMSQLGKDNVDFEKYLNKEKSEISKYKNDIIERAGRRETTKLKDVKHGSTIPGFSVTKELLIKIDNEAKSDVKKALKIVKSHYVPSIKRWIKSFEKIKQNLINIKNAHNDMDDISTQLRYEIASKYVKEYFEELSKDYYFTD